MVGIEESLAQLKKAVEGRDIIRLYWRSYPEGALDCVPLWVNRSLLTVCEIESFIRYNRIVTIRLSDIESIHSFHSYGDFIEWALHRNAQAIPSAYPQGDSFHHLLTSLLGSADPVTLIDESGHRQTSMLVSLTTTEVCYQQIDFCGIFCWPERMHLDRLIRVDVGGAYEHCLIEHARASPNCYDPEKDQP